MNTETNPKIELQLNPDGVAAPAQAAALICREVVDLYFAALATADLSKPPLPPPQKNFRRFDFRGPNLSAEARRPLHENWILAKVFQDLMRGVRASLEEAFLFIELLAVGTITARSSGTMDDVLAPFRRKASDLRFPPLLVHVNSRLDQPLEFIDAYRSMQAARNCLEHRGGIVAKFDAPDGVLELRFPGLKFFVVRDGAEIEMYEGFAVEAGEALMMRLVVRTRQFAVGERLILSAADFDEIAFACSHFGTELAQRLPKSSPPPTGSG